MPGTAGSFGGELGLVSLFDVGQLLLLNRATGRLEIVSGEFRGTLFFREGRIVNAADEQHREGEAIAFRIFEWKQGHFEFTPEPVGATGSIESGTEALMLEAARRLDESATTPTEGGAEARVRERKGALEALREVFHDVTTEARRFGAHVVSAPGQSTDALSAAGDRMVLRPGRPVRLRIAGQWREARDAALTAAEYEEFKNRLLGPTTGRDGAPNDPIVRYAVLNGKLNVAVTPVSSGARESLWLRPVELPAPDPARLEGPRDVLEGVLAESPALILVGGTDPDAVSEVIHALLGLLLERINESVLLVSECPVYRHAERPGVLAECAPPELATALGASSPGTLALDLARALPEDALRALSGVNRLIVAVPGDDVDEVRARWLTRFAAADRARVESHVTGWPVFLVLAGAPGVGGAEIPFGIWQIEGGESGSRAGAARPAAAAPKAA